MFPQNYGWNSDMSGNAGSCICLLQIGSQIICPDLLGYVNLTFSPWVVEYTSVHFFFPSYMNSSIATPLSYWGMKKGKKWK